MAGPLRISWSGLKTWESCRQQSFLSLQGRRAQVADGRIFLPGTLADRAMRRFLEQADGTHERGQMAAHVDALWEEHAERSPEYKIRWRGDPQQDRATVRGLAKRVVENVEEFLFRRVLPHEYEPELRFAIPTFVPDHHGASRAIILVGGMDIAVRHLPDREVVWIYDLKATENEEYVRGPIMGQLIFYGMAWALMMNQPHEQISAAFLTPACRTQFHPLEVTAQDRATMLSRITSYAQARWRDDPEDTATVNAKGEQLTDSDCWGCFVKHACPRFCAPVSVDGNGVRRASLSAAAALRPRSRT